MASPTTAATPSFRFDLGLKEALRSASDLEHRRIANMFEMMIRAYCERTKVAISTKTNEGHRAKSKTK